MHICKIPSEFLLKQAFGIVVCQRVRNFWNSFMDIYHCEVESGEVNIGGM